MIEAPRRKPKSRTGDGNDQIALLEKRPAVPVHESGQGRDQILAAVVLAGEDHSCRGAPVAEGADGEPPGRRIGEAVFAEPPSASLPGSWRCATVMAGLVGRALRRGGMQRSGREGMAWCSPVVRGERRSGSVGPFLVVKASPGDEGRWLGWRVRRASFLTVGRWRRDYLMALLAARAFWPGEHGRWRVERAPSSKLGGRCLQVVRKLLFRVEGGRQGGRAKLPPMEEKWRRGPAPPLRAGTIFR